MGQALHGLFRKTLHPKDKYIYIYINIQTSPKAPEGKIVTGVLNIYPVTPGGLLEWPLYENPFIRDGLSQHFMHGVENMGRQSWAVTTLGVRRPGI